MEKRGGWRVPIDSELAAFVRAQTSVFFATASRGGQPYVQHRGGPPGFLRVLDERTIAFADFAGNRQYITLGNLSENPKAQLLLIDYTRRKRVKIWGEARAVENDRHLIADLMPRDYKARVDQAIVFVVSAWDSNCQQHIPRRFEAADLEGIVKLRDEKIAKLETELRRVRAASKKRSR
jgi:uncharacterized protein